MHWGKADVSFIGGGNQSTWRKIIILSEIWLSHGTFNNYSLSYEIAMSIVFD
jgi:hypothetical protein